jgi:uncharacterized protein YukE
MSDAASFTVQPSELSDLADGFAGLIGELEDATSQVGNGNAGAAGAAELEQAISSFTSNWSNGLSDLHAKLGDLQTRLRGAADSYPGTDNAVGSTLRS